MTSPPAPSNGLVSCSDRADRHPAHPRRGQRGGVQRLILAASVVVGIGLASPRLVPVLAAPAAGGTSLHVLAVADTGSGNKHQMAVGQQMAQVNRRQPVDLVVLAGDNVYPDGDPAKLDQAFVKPYQELLAHKVPFFAVLGNHDIRTRNGEGQVAYPALGMGGRGYSLRRGPVEFFLLDTNVNAAWQHQLPWLDAPRPNAHI